MKKYFFIQLSALDLGYISGVLDSPLENLELDGAVDDRYSCTEIFGTELASVVTSRGIYRETMYTVAVPFDTSIYNRTSDYLLGHEKSLTNPWVFFRQSIIVSNQKSAFLIVIIF